MPFVKGDPNINRKGRGKGTISAIGTVKQKFEEDPEMFQEFIDEYIKDPNNRKHIVEMIDGKPQQSLEMGGDLTIEVVSYEKSKIDI